MDLPSFWKLSTDLLAPLGALFLAGGAGFCGGLRRAGRGRAASAADGGAGKLAALERVMAVIEFDMRGRILTANQNFLDLFGYRLDDIRGRHHNLLCARGLAERTAYRELWRRLARGEFETGEYRRLAGDGREIWIQASYNPIFDAGGRPCRVVEFVSDISFHREMESALLAAKEHAEHAVEVKSRFLANMSHEIRTPMNAILGFTELLLETPLDSLQRGHLDTLRGAARSLLALLNDVLDTARLERGAVELESIEFSLRELAEQTCAVLRPTAVAKGLALTLEYAADLGEHFRGDPLRVQQVLTNLLGNAIKFTGEGWVRLQVQAEGAGVALLVRDTGIGIPADRLERIFEPFAQADASMSRRFGGTGLGTTITRELVLLMGGRIEVESRVGAGTTFRVYLPLPPAQAGRLGDAQPRAGLPSLRVLLVDDLAQGAEPLALELGRRGHRVRSTADGAQALAELRRGRFDVVLMDIGGPAIDWLGSVRELRRIEQGGGLPRTPVVALGRGEDEREAAGEAGMDGFVVRGVAPEVLLDEIARVSGRQTPGLPLPQAMPLAAATDGAALGELRHLGEGLANTLRRGQLDDALLHRLKADLAGHGLAAFRLAVEQAIDDFDFDRALELLGELRSWLDDRLEEISA